MLSGCYVKCLLCWEIVMLSDSYVNGLMLRDCYVKWFVMLMDCYVKRLLC